MNTELSRFAAHLRESIDSGFQNQNFGALALDLFALQFKNNSTYRKLCEARRLTPDVVGHWTQIPAVPTNVFKELELTCLAPHERAAVFHSSGTTGQEASRHFHHAESLAVYEASLWRWFESIFGDVGELLFLTPNKKTAPRSSLVHMFETIRHKTSRTERVFVGKLADDGSWTIDFPATIKGLDAACAAGKPMTLLGTAFSFVHLLDYLAETDLAFQLPENSRVMETGGYKNRSRSIPKPELHALITEQLGVPPENIVCEFGMSELSSQAYAAARGNFRFPPWAQVQIISPETGREVREGETGLIRVFDLANVFSVASIQTEDLAIRHRDDFELIGRIAASELRGCSLMTA